MAELTAERLRQLLDCDPSSGTLRWRVARQAVVKAGTMAGALTNDGYTSIKIDGRSYLRHRLVWLYVHGKFPLGDLDHKDNIAGNDGIDNLRPATRTQNLANTRRPPSNTSGFKGVSWDKNARKWQAQIAKDRKKIKLGRFATAEEAHAAYLVKAKELFGEFANDGTKGAEIGEPVRRRVVIPQTIPAEPSPYVQPTPQHEPAPEKTPEKVPA